MIDVKTTDEEEHIESSLTPNESDRTDETSQASETFEAVKTDEVSEVDEISETDETSELDEVDEASENENSEESLATGPPATEQPTPEPITAEAQILSFSPIESSDPAELLDQVRRLEAILFASSEPVPQRTLKNAMPDGADIQLLLKEVQAAYADRGVNLIKVGNCWAFRTSSDLSYLLEKEVVKPRRLSKAAMETLSIIAYHQPVTRAEIEEIRGVVISKGTLDVLLETGWVRLTGHREVPGRPITYGTTIQFLDHFSLGSLRDLPGVDELEGAGLLQSNPPLDFPSAHNDDSPDTDSEIDDAEEEDDEEDLLEESDEDIVDSQGVVSSS